MPVIGSKPELLASYYDSSFIKPGEREDLLHVDASPGRLICCVAEQNQLVAFEMMEVQRAASVAGMAQAFEEARSQSRILGKIPWGRVQCSVRFGPGTLVPLPLFSEEKMEAHHRFLHTVEEESVFLMDRMPRLNAVNIYTLPSTLHGMFRYWFEGIEFSHRSTLFLNASLTSAAHEPLPVMFADFSESEFDLVVTRNTELILYNTYRYTTPEDVLYYLLFAAQQLQISASSLKIILSGITGKKDELTRLLEAYFPQVEMPMPPAVYAISPLAGRIKYHTCFPFFSRILCAS